MSDDKRFEFTGYLESAEREIQDPGGPREMTLTFKVIAEPIDLDLLLNKIGEQIVLREVKPGDITFGIRS